MSLENYALQQPGRQIVEAEAAGWMRQLFCGLQDIHSLGIVHRDIKPENLLLGPDSKLKIVDFGWCAWTSQLCRSASALAGTFHFMAPEILAEGHQTEAVDVWSAGATLLELLTGQPLITCLRCPTGLSASDPRRAAKERTRRVLAEISQKCPLPQLAKPAHLSANCWAFCQALLVPMACARSSVPATLSHVWLQRNAAASRAPGHIAGQSGQQAHGMPRWGLPLKAEHPRSWDGSTTASSSTSTPRAAVTPACQVLNWGDVGIQSHIWPSMVQPPLLAAPAS